MRYRLKNTINFASKDGMRTKRAGSLIDDAHEDIDLLIRAGGILLPNTKAINEAAERHLARSRGGDEWDLMVGDHHQRRWLGEKTGKWQLANTILVRSHRVNAGKVYDASTENLQQVLEHGGVLYAIE